VVRARDPSEVLQAPYDAVIFSLEGVVADTTSLETRAWQLLFDEALARVGGQPGHAARRFDVQADYKRYVAGRHPADAVAAFLADAGVQVQLGAPGDPADCWTAHGLAARQEDLFAELLSAEGVHVSPGARSLLDRLAQGRTPVGLVSSSRTAATLLRAVGLERAFAVVVDGSITTTGSRSEPDHAAFLEAVSRLGVTPGRVAVVAHSVSAVSAARRGGSGLVVAIDNGGQRRDLELAGADFVLDDLSELDLGAVRSDPWLLVYEGFDPAQETHREALTTLGNGYMATRGAMPEHADDGVHYPGTYLAGVYNMVAIRAGDHDRTSEELVNVPNWLPFDIAVEDGAWWSEGGLAERHERRELDLRQGLLTRTVTLTARQGQMMRVVQRRLVSMERPHLACLETTLIPVGWSGRVSIRSGIDTAVLNANAVDSGEPVTRHLTKPVIEHLPDIVLAEMETTASRIRIAMAVRTTVSGADARLVPEDTPDGQAAVRFDVTLSDGKPLVVCKLAAIVSSRDDAIASPRDGALAQLNRADTDFDELLSSHALAWRRLWEHYAVDVDTDAPVQLALNLHVFHILQTISPHTATLDAGVPARGLHGEGYQGHVFWDELFVLPQYILRTPEIARSLLDYRWRRLDAARQAAREAGHRGAMFPWQSGSDGRDVTPHELYNPRSHRWMPDNSWRQRHVGLAIAYNCWQYFQATGDSLWFAEHGAELLLEVARFFADLATYDNRDARFHISGVMGPDEYHDGYPDAPGQGLTDNAYTNVLTAWVCERAADALAALPAHEGDQLAQRLMLKSDELERWQQLGSRLAVPFHDGIISQFDGYCELLEFDWERYRRAYGNIERLDLILESEDDSTNRYRLCKQADVIMLIYLLGPQELMHVLAGLGYPVTADDLLRAVDHYRARSAHGSTLSRVVHTSVLAMLDQTTAWSEFREALDADLDDTQGGTTGRGIHLGAMAGTVDIVLRTFSGIRIEADTLTFRPHPPGALRRAAFELRYRDQRIGVTISERCLRLAAQPSSAPPIRINVSGTSVLLGGGQKLEFPA
jgi:trehalose/maltose hydrolase-like predicted phosphorylase/beta-phosphoglucomutase-like phosphatase (HAD superfamily)